ncbi:MAG: HypC/HybG/HupF family hydrogenase formation chaperone [Anaerolineae bacterium]|nr:HypC/HybG/HupF family hydrogenase formation chaperone [Anaerolineae bacterium]
MCLAVPARVETITGLQAEVEVGGVRRAVSVVLTPEVRPGDYVYVHTGYAISIVDEAEAAESLRLWAELAESYTTEELFPHMAPSSER